MASRIDLQAILLIIVGSGQVYFQPPENIQMSYPCITYKRTAIQSEPADDAAYKYKNKLLYEVTIIDPNPDSDMVDKVAALPFCSYNRNFFQDNLNHDVFNLFF